MKYELSYEEPYREAGDSLHSGKIAWRHMTVEINAANYHEAVLAARHFLPLPQALGYRGELTRMRNAHLTADGKEFWRELESSQSLAA